MHLPSHRDVDLALNINDLEDPAFSPVRKGVRFTPRPGLPFRANFPVVVLGEVSGTLRLQGSEGTKALAGVTLELADATGRIVQRQTSSYDGFFDFSELPPGSYELHLPASWRSRRHLKMFQAIQIQIEPSGRPSRGLVVELVPEA